MDLVKGFRIDLTFISLSERKVISCKEIFLTLFENRVEYKIVGEYESPDPETGIEGLRTCNYRWARPKSGITDLSMYYDTKKKCYTLELSFNGITNDWATHFSSGKECLKIYNLLNKYIYGAEN